MPPSDPSAAQATAAIKAALGQIGFCLPGSITIRHARCGMESRHFRGHFHYAAFGAQLSSWRS